MNIKGIDIQELVDQLGSKLIIDRYKHVDIIGEISIRYYAHIEDLRTYIIFGSQQVFGTGITKREAVINLCNKLSFCQVFKTGNSDNWLSDKFIAIIARISDFNVTDNYYVVHIGNLKL